MAETVPVRWSKEPEKAAWMLAHAGGRPIADVCRDFEAEFGHPLKRTQVTLFRAEHGMSRRRGNREAHRELAPLGSERVVKGYVYVKVRELPERAQSKDNWAFKHVLVWERSRGLRLPEGWMVLFCDRDRRNFDPANLKAVPRDLIGVLNSGYTWSDRPSLEAAVAAAMLKRGMTRVWSRPRACRACGREFTPDRTGRQNRTQRVCRECLDAGVDWRKYRNPSTFGPGTCSVCGAAFVKRSGCQKYCDSCRPYRIPKKR